jgi:hypothetical protein
MDWTLDWTGHGLVKHGLVKHGLVKHELVKHGLDLQTNLLSMIYVSQLYLYTPRI